MFIIMMNRIKARTRAPRTRTAVQAEGTVPSLVQVSIAARVRAAPAARRAREIFLAAARKTGGATRPLSYEYVSNQHVRVVSTRTSA